MYSQTGEWRKRWGGDSRSAVRRLRVLEAAEASRLRGPRVERQVARALGVGEQRLEGRQARVDAGRGRRVSSCARHACSNVMRTAARGVRTLQPWKSCTARVGALRMGRGANAAAVGGARGFSGWAADQLVVRVEFDRERLRESGPDRQNQWTLSVEGIYHIYAFGMVRSVRIMRSCRIQ